MKLLTCLLFLATVACRRSEADAPDPSVETPPEAPATSIEEQAVDSSLPGPQRARAAAARVGPALTRDLASVDLHLGDPVFLRAFKEERTLEVWIRQRASGKFRRFRSYPIAAASGESGPKLAEGDGQVPEGFYGTNRRWMKPDSDFHLAFNLGYPNAYDRHHGRTGSAIMIHGNRVSIGCLAMTDPKIEEIYTLVDAALRGGQDLVQVHLFPFRMTDERMAQAADHRWIDFWRNLREGHDRFERDRVPPDVHVRDGRYVIE